MGHVISLSILIRMLHTDEGDFNENTFRNPLGTGGRNGQTSLAFNLHTNVFVVVMVPIVALRTLRLPSS